MLLTDVGQRVGGLLRRGWAAFQRGRRSRPFWGGVLCLLAALELYSLTVAPMSVVVIQGLTGVSTIVICILITALTGVTWVQPHLRSITGITIVVLSLAALLVSNLGGFLVGTLLGLVGGALMFAWEAPDAEAVPPTPADTPTPKDAEPRPTGARRARVLGRGAHQATWSPATLPATLDQQAAPDDAVRAADVFDLGRPANPAGPAGKPASPGSAPRDPGTPSQGTPSQGTPSRNQQPPSSSNVSSSNSSGSNVSSSNFGSSNFGSSNAGSSNAGSAPGSGLRRSAMVLPLLAVLLGSPVHAVAAPVLGAVQQAAVSCLPWPLDWICVPAPDPTPAPTPNPPAPTGTGKPTSSPSKTPTPRPSSTQPTGTTTTSTSPAGSAGPVTPVPPGNNPTPSASPTVKLPAATCSASAYPAQVPAVGSAGATKAAAVLAACQAANTGKATVKTAAATDGVSAEVATLVSPKLTMTGLNYDGIVSLPTPKGPVRVLKFRLDKLQVAGLDQSATVASGKTLKVLSNGGDSVLQGNVVLYVFSLKGNAFGLLPLTFTPDSPPPLTLPYLVFTSTTSVTAYLSADSLTVPSVSLGSK